MKNYFIALCTGVLLCCLLCCCTGDFDGSEVQDTVAKYSQQIEDSKDVLNNAADQLQGVLDEARERLPAE